MVFPNFSFGAFRSMIYSVINSLIHTVIYSMIIKNTPNEKFGKPMIYNMINLQHD